MSTTYVCCTGRKMSVCVSFLCICCLEKNRTRRGKVKPTAIIIEVHQQHHKDAIAESPVNMYTDKRTYMDGRSDGHLSAHRLRHRQTASLCLFDAIGASHDIIV